MTRLFIATAIALAACTASDAPEAVDTGMAVRADTGAVATPMTDDPDRDAVGGAGVPAGYTARTDKPDAAITGAKYVASGGSMFEVTTGPAHILYAAKDVGAGNYTAMTTVELLEKPAHPEAFGLFIGGRDLDKPAQTYTYFIVRGTGEMLVKVREGEKTRDVVKWTANSDIPKVDGGGKASYALAAQVTNDAVKFIVNGKQVGSVSKAGLPTEGIAGLRINHNLHLKLSPVSVKNP